MPRIMQVIILDDNDTTTKFYRWIFYTSKLPLCQYWDIIPWHFSLLLLFLFIKNLINCSFNKLVATKIPGLYFVWPIPFYPYIFRRYFDSSVSNSGVQQWMLGGISVYIWKIYAWYLLISSLDMRTNVNDAVLYL